VDQQFSNSQNGFLWTLLADPANDAHLYAYDLQRLVNDFPQSGILQAMLAHASDDKNLKQASVYFNAKSVYKLINAPSAFIGVPDEKIIIQPGLTGNGRYKQDEYLPPAENLSIQHEEYVGNNVTETSFEASHIIETPPEITAYPETHEPAASHEAGPDLNNPAQGEQHHLTETGADQNTAMQAVENTTGGVYEVMPAIPAETQDEPGVINERVAEDEMPPVPAEENQPQTYAGDIAGADVEDIPQPQPEKSIIEETFDEIVPIEQISLHQEPDQPVIDLRPETSAPAEQIRPVAAIDDESEKLIKTNIVSTDFFMFDKAFGEHKQAEQAENDPIASPGNTNGAAGKKNPPVNEADHQDVSKYHDEKMPYTFMWWLDKTRKEHAGIYQPYVRTEPVTTNNRPKRPTDELQQQYFENIFHITSIDELDKGTQQHTVPFDMKRKEHVIIERFIKEEPQIKPQSSDKLDNENKAKKSSEDRDELVTETLAGIYSEQMLYHKAIASYKKLILKFPEKSRYFAAKIEQLEKKTN
jgi:hypothetical protein